MRIFDFSDSRRLNQFEMWSPLWDAVPTFEPGGPQNGKIRKRVLKKIQNKNGEGPLGGRAGAAVCGVYGELFTYMANKTKRQMVPYLVALCIFHFY